MKMLMKIESVKMLKEVLDLCIEKQKFQMGKCIKSYKTHPTQKWMYKYQLSDCIDTEIPVKKSEHALENIEQSVRGIYEKAGILKSCIKIIDKELFFQEYALEDEFVIPLLVVAESEKETVVKEISRKLSKIYCDDLPDKPLSHVYILECEDYYSVVFSLSHAISDGASQSVLLRLFRTLLRGRQLDVVPEYGDFVKMVEQKNSDTNLVDSYVDKMLALNESLPPIQPDYGTFWMKELDVSDETSWIDIIVRAVYELGKTACDKFMLDRVVVKTTVNSRDFYNGAYDLMIGDCHSNMFMIVENTSEFENFREEACRQIAVYYQQGGMDFTYLRLKSFDLEKDFDKNNKYQRLADTTKFAIAVNAVSASDREGALEKLNDMACQRARKNAAFGDYYRVCATVFDGKLIIQMPDGLKRKGK